MKTIIKIENSPPAGLPGSLSMGGTSPDGVSLGMTRDSLLRNGRPWLPTMGEFHYSRFPCAFWEEELLKMKAGGIQIVATYAFWNHHEDVEGRFDFSGRRNLRHFVELCARHGLPVWLRMGPFCHGEARNGGLPDWLYGKPFEARSDDARYLALVRRLYAEYAGQLKGLWFSEGGPIIGVQLENEFMQSCAPWETTQLPAMDYTPKGSGGEEHMRCLKRIAIESGVICPFYSCTAWGSPVPEGDLLPVVGGGYAFYAWEDDPATQKPTGNYLFKNLHARGNRPYDETLVPNCGCETGGGMQVFYANRPVVPPESIEGVSVVQMGSGSALMGFYMYHGGSNPVASRSYLNEHRCPRISYDFQAPVREFGQLAESYRRLKRHFLFLADFGEALATMSVSLQDDAAELLPETRDRLRAAARSDGRSGYVFFNNYQDHVAPADLRDCALELAVEGGTIRMPLEGGFSVADGASGVLPFNASLDGVRLLQSTCQMLARIEVGDLTVFFCFALDGLTPEHVLAADDIAAFTVRDGIGRKAGAQVVVRPAPGTGSLVDLTGTNGRKVRLVTLTAEQSLRFWKVRLAGRDRVLIADGTVLPWREDRIEFRVTGRPELSVSIYPSDDVALTDGKSALPLESDGIFSRFALSCPAKTPVPQWDSPCSGKAVVRLPGDAFDGVSDLFLRVRYRGDTGSAYLDGELVHDHFRNGIDWDIGLKRFRPRIAETELVLNLTPPRTRVRITEMAAIQTEDPADGLGFDAIELIPEYSFQIHGTKRQS
jgi:beta-galactosidase